MSTTAEKPDLTKVPNFGALRPWMEKLESWCKEAHACMDAQQDNLSELRADLSLMRGDLEEARRWYDELVEDLRDIPRGIRTLEEVMDELRIRDNEDE